jgi:hypothetical protein
VRVHAALAILLVLALGESGCDTPATISKFCTSTVAALQPGEALLDDLKASCIRELETQQDFGKFPIADPSAPECDAQGKRAEGLKAASKLLTAYFTALNNLASFDAVKQAEDVNALVAKVNMSPGLQKSAGAVAGFLTRVATSGYRQSQLASDLVSVREDVRVVMDGLSEAIGSLYLPELNGEAQKTSARYREYVIVHPEAALPLDARWQTDRATFDAKRKAVQFYQEALAAVIKGNAELAAHAHDLKAKDLSALLTSYSSQLDNLAPVIRKAFF